MKEDDMVDLEQRARFSCPKCGANECLRERRLNGNSRCVNGHTYPSRDAVDHSAQRSAAPALRQQPAPVDLELLNKAYAQGWAAAAGWAGKRHLIFDTDSDAYSSERDTRLLPIIDSAGKSCPCGEPTCTESWEPGCGLGESIEHAVPAEREPPRGDELRAILAHQPAPVVDEAARLLAICQNAHDRLLRGDDDSELLAILEQAWNAREALESP